jgi:hypothetical protein
MSKVSAKQLPWRDWYEWVDVYNKVKLFPEQAVFGAIDRLQIWESRCTLPIAVDATRRILEVMRCDPIYMGNRAPPSSSSTLVLGYSQAICRFVNLLVDIAQKGMVAVSMDSLAAQLEIPSWIIHFRHTVTHGSTVPSIDIARKAASEIMEGFLIPRYWAAQFEALIGGACFTKDDSGDAFIDTRLSSQPAFRTISSIHDNGIELMSEVTTNEDPIDLAVLAHRICSDDISNDTQLHKLSVFIASLSTESQKSIIIGELLRHRKFILVEHFFDNNVITRSVKLEVINYICSMAVSEDSLVLISRLISKGRRANSGTVKTQCPVSVVGESFGIGEFSI